MIQQSPMTWFAAALAFLFAALPGQRCRLSRAAGGSWIARDFRFHTGEVMPELRSTT